MHQMRVVLTGHSRGLGAAVANELSARAIPVLALARHILPAKRGITQVALDLSDLATLATWLAGGSLARFLSGADTVVLINNAGILQPVGPVYQHQPDSIARAINLNVAAPLMLAAAVSAAQVAERRVLHVSSGAGRNAYPGWSVYCAGKAALDQHARAVALDQVPGLRICSLAPGVIDTDMQAEIRASDPASFPLKERFEALKRDGGLAAPEECAQKLIDFALGPRFGEHPVANLRGAD